MNQLSPSEAREMFDWAERRASLTEDLRNAIRNYMERYNVDYATAARDVISGVAS